MSRVIYRFRVADGVSYEYAVALDAGESTAAQAGAYPRWAELEFHRCSNCSLNATEHHYCPIAMRLPPLIAIADRLRSYDLVTLEVEASERRVIQETTAQRALSSLLGLVMATSDCPHMRYMRPMARFHLPLASEEETAYRATSMYLLAQFYLGRQGREVDMTLSGLVTIYRDLQRINGALAERLRAASKEDTALNAIVLLDIFAKGVPYSIDEAMVEFRSLFGAYLLGQ